MPKNEITRIMSTNSHERTCAPLRLHPRNFTQPHSTAYYTKLGCSVAQYSPPILTLATLNPSNRQKPRHVAPRSRADPDAARHPFTKRTRHRRPVARVGRTTSSQRNQNSTRRVLSGHLKPKSDRLILHWGSPSFQNTRPSMLCNQRYERKPSNVLGASLTMRLPCFSRQS